MKNQGSYVPPAYIPLGQSDSDAMSVSLHHGDDSSNGTSQMQAQWSSGICACCDDMPSCCIGFFFPCYLFGKNAEFLGSGTFVGSCVTHFILWSLVNTACCIITDGLFWGLPGCLVSCYACGYRRTLRSKHNLPHRVGILLPIFAAICVPFVKSTVKYAKELGILKLQIQNWQ
ncbi:protein PLANT CADMIUM RESISTANCE 10 isoform X2 [Vicia villosa]|uniref:protein PLANT CADMIUM RESISTANCE 10 isoform X2 n=1 Tax=Vicia villosa TaxID=3911 RepID=UPI00273BDA99|nr:protein PLANT CADMIUM RESISTANCE 10 isoform X2 [Vicia villosa]